MHSNDILAGKANHNNFLGDFSMHSFKFKTDKFFQISIHLHPHYLRRNTYVYSVNTALQSLATKLDHYFKVSTDGLAVLCFLK